MNWVLSLTVIVTVLVNIECWNCLLFNTIYVKTENSKLTHQLQKRF